MTPYLRSSNATNVYRARLLHSVGTFSDLQIPTCLQVTGEREAASESAIQLPSGFLRGPIVCEYPTHFLPRYMRGIAIYWHMLDGPDPPRHFGYCP